MKLKDMKLEELELLSYTDLTYKILKEEKKTLNTPAIFHIICDLLGYGETEFEDKIGDYYTSLTIDKRFIMLENGDWDLREHHSVDINFEEEMVEEETEEETDEVDEDNEDEEIDVEEDALDSTIEDDLEDSDDDMDDLSILDEDELDSDDN